MTKRRPARAAAAPRAARPPTRVQQAAALGLADRTINRYLAMGMPEAAAGEALPAWATRARAWLEQNRGRSGPKPRSGPGDEANPEKVAYWELVFRRAQAGRALIKLQQERGEVHKKAECDREAEGRFAELRAALALIPDQMARKLLNAPGPEFIKVALEEALRDAMQKITEGPPPAPPRGDVGDLEQ